MLVLFMFGTHISRAQNPRITLYGSHVTDLQVQHSLPTSKTENKIGASTFQAGGGAEWLIKKEMRVELLYLHQSRPSTNSGAVNSSPKTSLNYILAGAGDHFINRLGKVNGFAGIMVGTSIINSANAEKDRRVNSAKFACGARIAGNYWFSPSVGCKLETMMLFTQNATPSSLITSSNTLNYTSVYQITIGAGLMFNL